MSEPEEPRPSLTLAWAAVAVITAAAVVLGLFAVTLEMPLLFGGLLLGLIGITLAIRGRIMDHAE